MMAVDVGGTFTDVVAVADGRIQTAKVSTDVNETDKSVVAGAAELGVNGASVSITRVPMASTPSSRGRCRKSHF